MIFGIFGGGKKDQGSKSRDRQSREEQRYYRDKEREFVKSAFDSQKRQSDERAKKGGW